MAEMTATGTECREGLDDGFREWMNTNLANAADEFGLVLSGTPVYGWRLRSVSFAIRTSAGEPMAPYRHGTRGTPRSHWTGLLDANAITGVPKPHVLSTTERVAHAAGPPGPRGRPDLGGRPSLRHH